MRQWIAQGGFMEFISLVLAIVAIAIARKASMRLKEIQARLTLLETSLAGGVSPATLPTDAPLAPPIVPETTVDSERPAPVPPPLPVDRPRYEEIAAATPDVSASAAARQ
jgi:hypothetical protein